MRRISDATSDINNSAQRDSIDKIEAVPFVSGVHKTNVTLTSGATVKVAHNLGRKWVGYFVTATLNDGGGGYFYATRTASDDKWLSLTAAAYTTNPQIELWIF